MQRETPIKAIASVRGRLGGALVQFNRQASIFWAHSNTAGRQRAIAPHHRGPLLCKGLSDSTLDFGFPLRKRLPRTPMEANGI